MTGLVVTVDRKERTKETSSQFLKREKMTMTTQLMLLLLKRKRKQRIETGGAWFDAVICAQTFFSSRILCQFLGFLQPKSSTAIRRITEGDTAWTASDCSTSTSRVGHSIDIRPFLSERWSQLRRA